MKRNCLILLLLLVPALAGATDFETSISGGFNLDDFLGTNGHSAPDIQGSLGVSTSANTVLEAAYRTMNDIEISSDDINADIDLAMIGLRYYPSGRPTADVDESRGYVGFDTGYMDVEAPNRDDSGLLLGLRAGAELPAGRHVSLYGETGYTFGFGDISDVGLFNLRAGLRLRF